MGKRRILVAALMLLAFAVQAQTQRSRNRYDIILEQQTDGSWGVFAPQLEMLGDERPEGLLEPYKAQSPVDADYIRDVSPQKMVYKRYSDHSLELHICPQQLSEPRPVVFFVHGGTWTNGSPKSMDHFARYFARKCNFVTVNVQYSLSPQKGIRAEHSCRDCLDAVEYVRRHAKELGADVSRMAFVGHSAGGHLAAYMALKTPQAKALVGWSGVYNFLTAHCTQKEYRDPKNKYYKYTNPYFHGIDGRFLRRISPECLVGRRCSKAVMLSYGGADYLVEPDQAISFGETLRRAGARVQMEYYPCYGHGIHSRSDRNRDLLEKTERFLEENLR